jgi:hypothetical protein
LFISFIRYRKKRCQPALFLFNPSAAQNANSGCPRGALIIQPHSSSSPCRFEFLRALPFALALPVEIIVFAALILVATPALTIPTASLPVVVIPVILGAVVASLVTVVSITVVVFVLC